VELLQQIASHLSLPSAAAFAFSNCRVCDTIGQQPWIDLRKAENKADKLTFLALCRKIKAYFGFVKIVYAPFP
jgi:hypothetical protein